MILGNFLLLRKSEYITAYKSAKKENSDYIIKEGKLIEIKTNRIVVSVEIDVNFNTVLKDL